MIIRYLHNIRRLKEVGKHRMWRTRGEVCEFAQGLRMWRVTFSQLASKLTAKNVIPCKLISVVCW